MIIPGFSDMTYFWGALILSTLILSYFLNWIFACFFLFLLSQFILFKKLSFRINLIILAGSSLFYLFMPYETSILFSGIDNRIRDYFFRVRGTLENSGKIVIVDIDQKSLEKLGQWPWPRTFLASGIQKIKSEGAKVIGLDIIFPEEDRNSFAAWEKKRELLGFEKQETLKKLTSEEVKRLIRTYWGSRLKKEEDQLALAKETQPLYFLNPLGNFSKLLAEGGEIITDNDQVLGEVCKQTKVVGGALFQFGINQEPSYQNLLEEGAILSSFIPDLSSLLPLIPRSNRQILNITKIQENLHYQGVLNIFPDVSGTARYYPMLFQAPVLEEKMVFVGNEEAKQERFNKDNYKKEKVISYYTYPSLALEMMKAGEGYNAVTGAKLNGIRGIVLKNEANPANEKFIPLNLKGEVRINYFGKGGRYQPSSNVPEKNYFSYVSFVDILEGRIPSRLFEDKYVMIGSSDTTLADLIGSPFSPALPGIEVHAQTLENMLSGQMIWEEGKIQRGLMFCGLLAFGTFFNLLISYSQPLLAGIFAFFGLIAFPITSYFSFAHYLVSLDFIFPWLLFGGMSFSIFVLNAFIDGREKKFIQTYFNKMVSPKILKKLKDSSDELALKGQRAPMTILFSDLVNFTAVSENLPPEEMVKIMNEYLNPMSNIILKYDGFIDKFIGDAIMAIWNVPYPQENHELAAVKCALEQLKMMDGLSKIFYEKYGFEISNRTGVNTGIGSAALMGADYRKNYTVIGDSVNLAARLETACGLFGVRAMISWQTYQGVKEEIFCRFVDKIVVKGRTQPVYAYEPLGFLTEIGDQEKKFNDLYYSGWEAYSIQEWNEAEKWLAKAQEIHPKDVPIKLLLRQIEKFRKTPPPKGWKGEHHLNEK